MVRCINRFIRGDNMKNSIQSKFAATLLAVPFFSLAAFADCPNVEGHYEYRCTVEKDADADFADLLETSGEMRIEQRGCESFSFLNISNSDREEISLLNTDDGISRTNVKIRKSTGKLLRFKSVNHGKDLGDILTNSAEIFKATIRKTKKGFTFKGREKSRVFGIFSDRHSKFKCNFKKN